MHEIRRYLYDHYPETKELLDATRYFGVEGATVDDEIRRAYQDIRKHHFIGEQYIWLGSICKAEGLKELEMCLHRDDKPFVVLKELLSKDSRDGRTRLRLGEPHAGTSEYTVFRYYVFPVWNLTKIDMLETARRRGWMEIMQMTVFCHQPRPGGKPCGLCNTCRYTMDEGLAWRIPWDSRLRAACWKKIGLPIAWRWERLMNMASGK